MRKSVVLAVMFVMLVAQQAALFGQTSTAPTPSSGVQTPIISPSDKAPQTGTPSGTTSCCQGGSSPLVHCTHCPDGKNLPKTETLNPDHSTTETPIDVPQVGEIGGADVLKPYYKLCKDFEVEVPVPVCNRVSEETCLFTTKTYTSRCCKFTVCIPCAKRLTTSQKCELVNKKHKIRACVRADNGGVDVYVIDVPGMPKEWMLYINTIQADVEKQLNIQL